MIFTEFKLRVAAFSSNRANLDKIPLAVEKANISLIQVCRDTIPLRLIKKEGSNRKILRYVGEIDQYICVPNSIKDDDVTQIEMDELLIDAVALHMLAGIETARSQQYMGMYWNIVENHEKALIEFDLSKNEEFIQDMINDTERMSISKEDLNVDTNSVM